MSVFSIVDKNGTIAMDSKGLVKHEELKNKLFLVNRFGYICEVAEVKNGKVLYRGLNDFEVVNNNGKKMSEGLYFKVFDENNNVVDLETLDFELDLVTVNEVYKVIIEDNVYETELLEGWKCSLREIGVN